MAPRNYKLNILRGFLICKGMPRSNAFPIILGSVTIILVMFALSGKHKDMMPTRLAVSEESQQRDLNENKAYRQLYYKWRNCTAAAMAPLKGDSQKLWSGITGIAQKCEKELGTDLKVLNFRNRDETKYHILPRVAEQKSNFISLGIGHDIKAEEQIRDTLGKTMVDFYGADPITDVNEKLYLTIGQYFPFAVGANAGISKASVFNGHSYSDKQVVHIDAIYFWKYFVKQNFIDELWLDAEGAEFGLFPYFFKNGQFDQNGITICQMNMEIHGAPSVENRELTHDFFFKMVEDGRYAFLKFVYVGHIRTYFVNFEDPKCAQKYLPQ